MAQTLEPTTQHGAAGKPTRRQDAFDKVTGRTRYAGDLAFPGLLHARLVLSPYGHARILNIDTTAALALPGVVAVYTGKTLGMAKANSTSRSQAPLAQDEVYWCGHPVAIVLAETEEAADDGAAAVDVDYDSLPVIVDPLEAMAVNAPLARTRSENESSEIAGGGAHAAVANDEVADEPKEALSKNVSDTTHLKFGDIEEGLREAEVVVERSYRTSSVHQSYLEPQSITVVPSKNGQQLTVWPSSQGMFSVREDIFRCFRYARAADTCRVRADRRSVRWKIWPDRATCRSSSSCRAKACTSRLYTTRRLVSGQSCATIGDYAQTWREKEWYAACFTGKGHLRLWSLSWSIGRTRCLHSCKHISLSQH